MIETGFQRPKYLECDYESLTDKYGRFSCQPFERGYGITVGNALRRILLSSVTGAAITAVRIQDVLHEFSSIPGVVEDVTDIILNLKSISLKLKGSEPKIMTLKKRARPKPKRRILFMILTSRSSIKTFTLPLWTRMGSWISK